MPTSKKGANTGLNLEELKSNVEKGTTIINKFGESVKASIGASVEEFTKMRNEMKQLGIGFEALEKLTLKVQGSYNDEVKKLQKQKEAALKASKDAEMKILMKYMNDYIKLTDHGRKEADPEKYKELLKKKEDALEAHHLKMTVEQKVYTDNIKKLQDESQKISLDGIRDYYGAVGEAAHNTFKKISELANQGASKVDGFLEDNAWASGAIEIGKEYKSGLDKMTKYYDQQEGDIEAKYKRKKAKLQAELNALTEPSDTLDKTTEKIEASDARKEALENEIKNIDEDPNSWTFDPKGQKEKYNLDPKGDQTQPTDDSSQSLQESLDSQIPISENDEESEEDKETKRQEQVEKRREYLQQLLDEENAYSEELITSKENAQKRIDEINENGFKTEADLRAEMAKLDKEKAEEDAKLKKKKAKITKQEAKIKYLEDIASTTRGIITSTASTAEAAAKALAAGPIVGPILAAMITAKGAIEIATQTRKLAELKNTSPFEDGGLLNGKRHRDGGMRIEGTNIEVEGGEYVINRESTKKNLGLISYINKQRRALDSDDLHNFSSPMPSQRSSFLNMLKEDKQVPMMPISNTIEGEILDAIRGINFQPRVAVTDIHHVQQQMAQVDEWVGI